MEAAISFDYIQLQFLTKMLSKFISRVYTRNLEKILYVMVKYEGYPLKEGWNKGAWFHLLIPHTQILDLDIAIRGKNIGV